MWGCLHRRGSGSGFLFHGLPRDPGLFDNADELFPIAFQARTHRDILTGMNAVHKALPLGKKFFQVATQGILIDLWNVDDGMKLAVVFLIDFEFLKTFAVQAYFSEEGIQPDHDGVDGKPSTSTLRPVSVSPMACPPVTTEWKNTWCPFSPSTLSSCTSLM